MLTEERLNDIVARVEEFDRTRNELAETTTNPQHQRIRQVGHQMASSDMYANARDDLNVLSIAVRDLISILHDLVERDPWDELAWENEVMECRFCRAFHGEHKDDCIWSEAKKLLKNW